MRTTNPTMYRPNDIRILHARMVHDSDRRSRFMILRKSYSLHAEPAERPGSGPRLQVRERTAFLRTHRFRWTRCWENSTRWQA
jgi:hypothetical protein